MFAAGYFYTLPGWLEMERRWMTPILKEREEMINKGLISTKNFWAVLPLNMIIDLDFKFRLLTIDLLWEMLISLIFINNIKVHYLSYHNIDYSISVINYWKLIYWCNLWIINNYINYNLNKNGLT